MFNRILAEYVTYVNISDTSEETEIERRDVHVTAAADAAVSYITMFYWTSLCPSQVFYCSTKSFYTKHAGFR